MNKSLDSDISKILKHDYGKCVLWKDQCDLQPFPPVFKSFFSIFFIAPCNYLKKN